MVFVYIYYGALSESELTGCADKLHGWAFFIIFFYIEICTLHSLDSRGKIGNWKYFTAFKSTHLDCKLVVLV